jgi:c-di-GMP-binding flagellar brake protein YcgR
MLGYVAKPSPKNLGESRRGFVRIPVPATAPIQVRFADGRTYSALDLSVYGIAFAGEMTDTARFSMAQSWPDVRFDLEGASLRVRAKVVHLQSDAVPGKLKIGVEFTEISPDDVFTLSEYIARHSGLGQPTQVRALKPRRAKPRKKSKAKKR